jgi:hypothetical protein
MPLLAATGYYCLLLAAAVDALLLVMPEDTGISWLGRFEKHRAS